MFRFVLVFVYVLYNLIRSSQSSPILSSFNETCSSEISCVQPLVCSDTNRCLCSKSSSVWNENFKDCFSCPTGWLHWENNHCLSLAMKTTGGINYDQAYESCQSLSGQLFYFYNLNQFKQFQNQITSLSQSSYAESINLFFRVGAWINKHNMQKSEDIWCDDNVVDSTLECAYIKNSDSLCLSRTKCDQQLPFICDVVATSESFASNDDESDELNQRFLEFLTALAPVALNVLNGLAGNNPQQQPQQPQQPQQIVIQQDPSALAAKNDNKMYILIGIIVFILILVFCCVAGVLLYFFTRSNTRSNERTSIESTSSYG